MLVVVGRLGRAHGIRGEVVVDVRTDEPEERFAPGTVLLADPGDRSLTVASARWHSGRLLLTLDGVVDRTAAEQLRGTVLSVDVDPAATPEEADAWYDHQLVGLTAVAGADLAAADVIGTVSAVLHLPGQDVLEIARDGREPALVPFVAEFVPEVDVERGRLLLTPPPGLLDADEPVDAGEPAGTD